MLSLCALNSQGLSSADILFQVGAIVFHPETKRFLLFIKRRGRYNLPAQPVEGNLDSLLMDPLGFVRRETGHKIDLVRFRTYERQYDDPFNERDDLTGLWPVETTATIDAFKVTVDTLEGPKELSQEGQPRQVITIWFAGVIVDPDPPEVTPVKITASTVRVGHLLRKPFVFNEFLEHGYAGMQEYAVLETFVRLWNLTFPDKKIR
ncbi:hypothetical protein AURDEDRAFT_171342 [Auricularia subglabra TFB-10046 SS5]|uniref:Nudix hydrolase domain-containing protein n=1 Tax=Auricularia subglabra (strain TFB-10046 / SS5) TaxID=717982 RepID=J0LIT4_AURST|nr:hypothetical protein AURDEDRAFT_171342 [Auricularia subglabra TFB-10046 SS5]